jgi:hypothetical protein
LRRALIQGLKITTFAPHLGMCMWIYTYIYAYKCMYMNHAICRGP